MKKFLYAVAAVALFAGCAKDVNEAAVVAPKEGNAILTLNVSNSSRAVFDGDSHITWEANDKIKALLAPDLEGTVAKSDPCDLTFGGDDTKPVFSGTIKGMENQLEKFYVFGVYPSAADVTGTYATTLEKRVVSLANKQAPSQSAWDGKADVMLIEPQEVTGTEETYTDYNDDWDKVTFYRLKTDAEIKFAHLFGFGCLSFNTLPADIADAKVGKCVITAVGDNKNLAGTFTVDLRKSVVADDFALTSKAGADAITIVCDNTIALKDFKAWFVANPGNYDIAIDLVAGSNKVHFERKGLVIKRAAIAKPVVNFKEGDTSLSSDIDLTGGKLWQHDTNDSYLANGTKFFLSSTQLAADWGTVEGVQTMEFGISYSKAASLSPKADKFNNEYVQILNYSSYNSGNAVLTSTGKFKGINNIKVSCGITRESYNAEVSAFIIDAEGAEHQIGETKAFKGNSAEVLDFYFEQTEAIPDGQLKVVWDNISSNYANMFVKTIAVNPAPSIKFDCDVLSIPGAGGSGTVNVAIACAKGEPVVKSDAEWLKISYADGVISYTADANDGDDTRKANIIVSAEGNSAASNTLVVSQISSKLAEFKFQITPADIKSAIDAAAAAYEAENGSAPLAENVLSFNATVTATATDGSGATKEIELYFNRLKYGSLANDVFKFNGNYPAANTGYAQNTSSVGVVTSVFAGMTTQWSGYFDPCFSKDNTTYDDVDAVRGDADANSIYTWTASVPAANEYAFFRIRQASERDYAFIGATFLAKK